MTEDNKRKFGAAIDSDGTSTPKVKTLAQMHASGQRAFDEDFLKRAGKTVEEALEAFGECTPAEFKKLVYLHTMPTDGDKVFTNPNLVQGVATIKGAKPGSVEEAVVRKSLETADKQRNFLSAALSVSNAPEVVPEWQKTGQPATAAAPVVEVKPVAPVVVDTPAKSQMQELEELSAWSLSNKKSRQGRLKVKSFSIETETVEFMDLISKHMTEELGYEMSPSIIVRRALRIGLAEIFKQDIEVAKK